MLYFDSQSFNTLLAFFTILHIVSTVPSDFRPERRQLTAAEIDAEKIIKREDISPTGLVVLCGLGAGLGVSCGESSGGPSLSSTSIPVRTTSKQSSQS